MNKAVIAALLGMAMLGGCASKTTFRGEEFKENTPYKRTFSVSAKAACEGAQMAMLSQGYRISESKPTTLTGQKDFKVNEENFATIELRVVCMSRDPEAIVFANAVKTLFELKKTRQSTGVGIPVLGQISLPVGTTPESLVKVGIETVTDPDYYSSFFDQVSAYAD